MTVNEHLAYNLLELFNYATLRRVGPRQYEFFGQTPAYYKALFPGIGNEPCVEPWAHSFMLDFFLDQAEEFFAKGDPGSISSGIWQEDALTPDNMALNAIAANLCNSQVIIICLLREDFSERLGIMRRAREQLLENRQLTTNLHIFKEKSRIDGLTGLLNKITFMELMFDEMTRCQIMEYPLVLLILDIDYFKKVNDTYGHLVGDKILQNLGTVLKRTLRRNDIVARYGGEEFAVLISHSPMTEAVQIAEKVRSSINAMVVPKAPGITISVGCTVYRPGEPHDSFVARTDEALYDAKKGGRNQVCVK